MGEAYWDVVEELEGTPAQEMALRTHYGVGGNEEAPFCPQRGVGSQWVKIFFQDLCHFE